MNFQPSRCFSGAERGFTYQAQAYLQVTRLPPGVHVGNGATPIAPFILGFALTMPAMAQIPAIHIATRPRAISTPRSALGKAGSLALYFMRTSWKNCIVRMTGALSNCGLPVEGLTSSPPNWRTIGSACRTAQMGVL